MSTRIMKNFAQLKLLKAASPEMRKKIMEKCKKTLMCCLCECALNVLKGNVPLKKSQKSRLSRFKQKLRKLTSKKTRQNVKRRIVQTGGFLGALLTPVLSFLGTLLSNKI